MGGCSRRRYSSRRHCRKLLPILRHISRHRRSGQRAAIFGARPSSGCQLGEEAVQQLLSWLAQDHLPTLRPALPLGCWALSLVPIAITARCAPASATTPASAPTTPAPAPPCSSSCSRLRSLVPTAIAKCSIRGRIPCTTRKAIAIRWRQGRPRTAPAPAPVATPAATAATGSLCGAAIGRQQAARAAAGQQLLLQDKELLLVLQQLLLPGRTSYLPVQVQLLDAVCLALRRCWGRVQQ